MTDKNTPAEAGNGAEAIDVSKYTPEQTQAYIAQLRDEAKQRRLEAEALASKLLDQQRRDEEKQQALLKEQGNFKTLYEQTSADLLKHKTAAEQASAYKDAFQKQLDARIAAIPEGMRSLVPEGMEPIALSQYLDRNAALLANRKAPNLDAGAGGSSAGGGKGTTLSANDVQMAQALNMTPEQYAKRRAEARALRDLPPEE